MPRRRKLKDDEQPNAEAPTSEVPTPGDDAESVDGDGDEGGDEPIPQDTLVCALTGEFKPDKPEERVLQSFVEQLHREYHVELLDMERDVRLACQDAAGKKKTVTVGIAVYEHGKPHEVNNIIPPSSMISRLPTKHWLTSTTPTAEPSGWRQATRCCARSRTVTTTSRRTVCAMRKHFGNSST